MGALAILLLAAACIDDSAADPVMECAQPQVACEAECRDVRVDPEHCGTCGHVCDQSELCSAGECVAECGAGLAACGRTCRALASEAGHCGACDAPCLDGFACVDGACRAEGSSSSDLRIRVHDSQLSVCGRPIFMNGANTPWHRWNDFGGDYDAAWWSDHFAALQQTGVNSSRVWLTCDGQVGIDVNADGAVLGPTPEHWEHLDSFFAIAQEQHIYVMATLMSFDHFESGAADRWQAWIASDANIDSYIENYLRPFLERYGDNPYLWSIDLLNEPDWTHEREGIGWQRLRAYFARAARAIHENSEVLVTVGMASPKYSGPCAGCEPAVSDAQLLDALDAPSVYLDFYSPHYYDWIGEVWGNTLHMRPSSSNFPPGKPLLVGEHPAHGTAGNTLAQDIEAAWQHDWQGTMPWTSNGVDRNGGLPEVSEGAATFRDAHPALVAPPCP